MQSDSKLFKGGKVESVFISSFFTQDALKITSYKYSLNVISIISIIFFSF